MQYVCDYCGRVYDEDELYKDMCCTCGGSIVEGRQCAVCGEWYGEDELYGGVCLDCIKDNASAENAVEFGMLAPDMTEGIRSLFSDEEILRILVEEKQRIMAGPDEFAKDGIRKRAQRYLLECDRDEFGEFIKRQNGRK